MPGTLFASDSIEQHVFRAAVLSIVLALALGQNAVLLCQVWCDPPEAAATGCHHEDGTPSPTLARDAECDDGLVGIADITRPELRRGVSDRDHGAVAVVRFLFAPPSTGTLHSESGAQLLLQARPLVTPLRL